MERPLGAVDGARVIAHGAHVDERGAFRRLYCRETLGDFGVDAAIAQANLAHSLATRTLRGLHYQTGAAAETKLFHCVAGALFDVVLDLRPGSPTYGATLQTRLDAGDGRAVLIPAGCAHGYMTLAPQTTVLYFTTAAYDPEAERGVRWNDPAFAIPWPADPAVISEKDRAYPDWRDRAERAA